jgi:hypothetical protein
LPDVAHLRSSAKPATYQCDNVAQLHIVGNQSPPRIEQPDTLDLPVGTDRAIRGQRGACARHQQHR